MTIQGIIEQLQNAPSRIDQFNPYNDICTTHDLPNAPETRRKNLKQYLEAQLDLNPKSFWIGESPGYNGVRRSGLYLLSEPQLEELSNRLHCAPFQKATKTADKATNTSKQVWKMIQTLPEVPLTYDAFPFHLMQSVAPFRNRSPKRAELRMYAFLLKELIQLFQPETVIAIGRKAEFALRELEIPALYVRHPAHGGQPAFEAGILSIYS